MAHFPGKNGLPMNDDQIQRLRDQDLQPIHICDNCGREFLYSWSNPEQWVCDECAERPVIAQATPCNEAECKSCPMRLHAEECEEYQRFLVSEGERLAPADYKCNGYH